MADWWADVWSRTDFVGAVIALIAIAVGVWAAWKFSKPRRPTAGTSTARSSNAADTSGAAAQSTAPGDGLPWRTPPRLLGTNPWSFAPGPGNAWTISAGGEDTLYDASISWSANLHPDGFRESEYLGILRGGDSRVFAGSSDFAQTGGYVDIHWRWHPDAELLAQRTPLLPMRHARGDSVSPGAGDVQRTVDPDLWTFPDRGDRQQRVLVGGVGPLYDVTIFWGEVGDWDGGSKQLGELQPGDEDVFAEHSRFRWTGGEVRVQWRWEPDEPHVLQSFQVPPIPWS